MKLNTYLSFSGNCAEAFRFYETALGARQLMMSTWGDSPMASQAPPGWEGKVMHARLEIGGQVLMGSDGPPDHHVKSQGFHVSVQVDSPEEADRVFAALADGANIVMPIQKTFWSPCFGMLVDRFGIPWMVNCENDGEHP